MHLYTHTRTCTYHGSVIQDSLTYPLVYKIMLVNEVARPLTQVLVAIVYRDGKISKWWPVGRVHVYVRTCTKHEA